MAVYTIKVCTESNNNKVVVYNGSTIIRVMKCSTKKDNATYYDGEGTCKIIEKVKDTNNAPYWHMLNGSVYGQYCSRIGGGNKGSHGLLFHSVPYYSTSHKNLEVEEFNKLGQAASLGCVRLCVRDAKWIFDNCDVNSTVEFVKTLSVGQEPMAVPTITTEPTDPKYGWDPTDPNSDNPYGDEYSNDFTGGEYPFVVNENGHFISADYPDLASPYFIAKGSHAVYNGQTITGVCDALQIYPRTKVQKVDIKYKYGIDFDLKASVLPNCVGFVRARWLELSGGTNYLSSVSGNADQYWKYRDRLGYGYSTDTPKLGAIACWGSNHIAVVERILDDGTIYVSESGYNTTKFTQRFMGTESGYQRGARIGKLSKNEYRVGSKRSDGYGSDFQGFIYYPGEYTSAISPAQETVWEDLYSEPAERTDATVRTVGYYSTQHIITDEKPIDDKVPQVATVNYTPTLQALYNYLSIGGQYTTNNTWSENITNTDFDISGCSGNFMRQDVINYLLNAGFSRAQTAGICGNIYVESGYRPWAVQNDRGVDKPQRNTRYDTLVDVIAKKGSSTGIGLVGWTYNSITYSMVAYCEEVIGKQWWDTLVGQLDFLVKVQLKGEPYKYKNYASTDSSILAVYTHLLDCPNTLEGAKQACKVFMNEYERPGVPHADWRLDETERVFNNIIPYQKKEGESSGATGGHSVMETR